MPNKSIIKYNLDWSNIPEYLQKLYRSALSVARSTWQRSLVIEMFQSDGCIRPIEKLPSKTNTTIARHNLESLIKRLNTLREITVFVQDSPVPAHRSYRINLPFEDKPVYVKPSKNWGEIPPKKLMEPYDINVKLIQLAEQKNPLYALPIARRLIGVILDPEEVAREEQAVSQGLQKLVYGLEKPEDATKETEIDTRTREYKQQIYYSQLERRKTKLHKTNTYMKSVEEMYGGEVIVAKCLPSPDTRAEHARRQHAFNYLMKRANASGIQITRTERSGFVHYEIDYQHAGAVRYLPPMQPDEYLNLDAFRPANLKRRRKLLVKRKRKTNGSIRKFAGTRAKKGKRPHFKPDDSKMISLDKLYTKMDTEVAPKKETK